MVQRIARVWPAPQFNPVRVPERDAWFAGELPLSAVSGVGPVTTTELNDSPANADKPASLIDVATPYAKPSGHSKAQPVKHLQHHPSARPS
jgi:hypothetical protein